MSLFSILLTIHITGGGISLILGLYQLIARKGNRRHKRVGRVYYYAMLTAAIVALPMTYLHPSYFLFIVSAFTIYMLLTGVRYLKKKTMQDVDAIDWILTLTMGILGVVFIGSGLYSIMKSNFFGIVLCVFGAIGLLFVYQDYINFTGKSSVKNYWITTHLQRMTGSYIASVTAFLVVNNTILPGIIAWLLPTLLLVPFIIKWSRQREIKIAVTKAGWT